jgi:hypothetical protein
VTALYVYRPFLGGKKYYIVIQGGNIGEVVTCKSFPDVCNVTKPDSGSVPVCKVRICDSERQPEGDKDRRGAISIDRTKDPPTNVHIRTRTNTDLYILTHYIHL